MYFESQTENSPDNVYPQKKGKQFKVFVPIIFVVVALVVGYYSFYKIADIEEFFLHDTYALLTQKGILIASVIEHLTLGILALILFVTSKKWYLPLFLYSGFIASYSQVTYANDLFSFNPLVPYAVAGIMIVLGFRFLKKWQRLFLVVPVVLIIMGQANYNSYLITGHYLSYKAVFTDILLQ